MSLATELHIIQFDSRLAIGVLALNWVSLPFEVEVGRDHWFLFSFLSNTNFVLLDTFWNLVFSDFEWKFAQVRNSLAAKCQLHQDRCHPANLSRDYVFCCQLVVYIFSIQISIFSLYLVVNFHQNEVTQCDYQVATCGKGTFFQHLRFGRSLIKMFRSGPILQIFQIYAQIR